jgi:hypothetical protein
VALVQQVFQRVLVEHGDERRRRLVEHAGQGAGRSDHAVGAIDQLEAFLGLAHHLADDDLVGGTGQGDAAAPAAHGAHEAGLAQVLHHLHQMVLRDLVEGRDLADRGQAVVARRQVQQHAHGVVGVARQAHRNSRRSPQIDGLRVTT